MAGPFEVVYAAQQREQFYEQISENNARNVAFSVTFTSTGDGEAIMTKSLVFDTVFTERPHVSGAPVIMKAPDSKTWLLPRAQAGVYRWITEKSPAGLLYTGCYPYFIVDVPVIPNIILDDVLATPNVVIEHHLRFDGIGLKKLPNGILDMPQIEVS